LEYETPSCRPAWQPPAGLVGVFIVFTIWFFYAYDARDHDGRWLRFFFGFVACLSGVWLAVSYVRHRR
jgi:hypothetical protein